MEAQVEAMQKFVVKQERVLFQLNPEKLGTLTVFMKKHGIKLMFMWKWKNTMRRNVLKSFLMN